MKDQKHALDEQCNLNKHISESLNQCKQQNQRFKNTEQDLMRELMEIKSENRNLVS